MEHISLHEHSKVEQPFLERISYYFLLATVFLFPFFFAPGIPVPFQISKSSLLAFLVLVPLICSLFNFYRSKKIVISKSPVILVAVALFVIALISAFVGGTPIVSLVGQGFETGTVGFLALGIILMILTFSYVRTKERVLQILCAFSLSVGVLLVFHVARLFFGPGFLSFGVLATSTATAVGRWNDLGILFGAGAVLSFVTLEFLNLENKAFTALTYVGGALSLAFLVAVNFSSIWYALGFIALCAGLLQFFRNKKVPYISIAVLALSIIFLCSGSFNAKVVDYFKLSEVEVRPSLQATWDIAQQTFKTKPVAALFGAGPNRFSNQYQLFKPQGVNNTIFWNYDFDAGIGFIPTFLVTTGILGFLAWVIFLALFLYKGIRTVVVRKEHPLMAYLVTSSFFVATYLWIMAAVYTTSSTNIALAFIFTGMTLSLFLMEHEVKADKVIHFGAYRIPGVVYTIFALILVIIPLIWAVTYFKIFVASAYFQSGVTTLQSGGKIDDAEVSVLKATQWSQSDLYYQMLAEIGIIKMSNLVSAGNLSKEDNLKQMSTYLNAAVESATKAVIYNPTNYQNWVEAGRVSESVLPLQVKDSYTQASNSYIQAIGHNPQNPALYLMLARLEMTNKNLTDAKKYVGAALQLKNNYAEAAFLLSQIQVQEGNLPDAIKSVQAATQFSPNDPTLFFQLGLLQYNYKDYTGAIDSLSHAVGIDTQYSNARYFLGLSYAKLGQVDEAIAQFVIVQQYNPTSDEVALILQNLRAGKAPFNDAKPPVDNKPEKRKTLPVKDDTKTKAAATTSTI